MGMQICTATMKNNVKVPQKLKMELPYDPAIPLLGTYPDKTIILKDTCTVMSTAALLKIAKKWKHLKCLSMTNR